MIVDSSRIRKDSLKEFKRTRTSFEKAEKELSIFENEDQPAYQKWYRTELGPLHEEIKQVCEKIEALKSKMIRIQELADRKGWALQVATSLFESHPSEFERIERELEEAFQRIIDEARRRAEERSAHEDKVILDRLRQFLNNNTRTIAKLLENAPSPGVATMTVIIEFANLNNYSLFEVQNFIQLPGTRELLAAHGLPIDLEEDEDPFEMLEENDDRFFEEGHRGGQPPSTAASTAKKTHDRERIKTLWRELAFALHPDQSDSSTNKAKLDLWHQVQEAMATGDLDRLEVLHAHLQVLQGSISENIPLSRVKNLIAMYRESREALRRRIRKLRRTDAWGFRLASEERREELKSDTRIRLRQEINFHREKLEQVRSDYENWFKPRAPRNASRQRTVSPDQPGFPELDDLFR